MELGERVSVDQRNSLPYIIKTQAPKDEPQFNMNDFGSLEIRTQTQKQNEKVNFILDLLGKNKEEEEDIRLLERERERLKEEERRMAYETSNEAKLSSWKSERSILSSRGAKRSHGYDLDFEEFEKVSLPKSVAQRLEYRLNQLRSDPTKRNELEDRVGKRIHPLNHQARYKAKRFHHIANAQVNVIEENKKRAKESTFPNLTQTIQSRSLEQEGRRGKNY